MMQWLKHAFAIDKPGPAQPTPDQQTVVDRMCAEVVRRQMAGPAIVFLETLRPLNFVSAQALHFLSPFVSVMVDSNAHKHLAAFLEHRGSIDYLCDRIGELDADRESAGGQTHRERSSTAMEQNDAS
jgi:hypothetical protein